MRAVSSIENTFKSISEIDLDLTKFPIKNSAKKHQVGTDKDKSKNFGEVFTPIWLVDYMVKLANIKNPDTRTLDLCAGYGQFSIRLLRYYANKFNYNSDQFLKNHYFSELQLQSCFKLLTIFGSKINLFIGDSTALNKVPAVAKGIWCHLPKFGGWVCLTKTVVKIFRSSDSEDDFASRLWLLISYFDEEYVAMKNELVQICRTRKGRLETLSLIKDRVIDIDHTAWQTENIPEHLVSGMFECLDDVEGKSILVLFNAEIIEYLIYSKGVDPKNITFGAEDSSELIAKYVKSTYGVDYKIFDKDPKSLREVFDGIKFDVCLSNPPYNRGLDLKIISSLLGDSSIEQSLAKEYIIVHPSIWLLDRKGKLDLYDSIKSRLSHKLKAVRFFNGNAIFNISLMVPCIITHIDIEHNSPKTKVKFFDEDFSADDLGDITKFGKSWLAIVKPFVMKIEEVVKTTGQVWLHNTRTIELGKEYCQLAAIRGNVSYDTASMVKDDFYTMTVDIDTCRGIRQLNLNRPGNPTPTFGFKTAAERDNFLHYVNTDFARFCLAIYKNNCNLAVGEMALIPWLDFTQEWNDEKLFRHFDINKETQDYIRNFLPDYYGIRG